MDTEGAFPTTLGHCFQTTFGVSEILTCWQKVVFRFKSWFLGPKIDDMRFRIVRLRLRFVDSKSGIVDFKSGIVDFKSGIVDFRLRFGHFKAGMVDSKLRPVHFKARMICNDRTGPLSPIVSAVTVP